MSGLLCSLSPRGKPVLVRVLKAIAVLIALPFAAADLLVTIIGALAIFLIIVRSCSQ
jgi:hypothetical protein